MDVDIDTLIIPEQSYSAIISLPSDEFQRIVQDLQSLDDMCTISAKNDSIKFSVAGDMGLGGVLLRTIAGARNQASPASVNVFCSDS
jgi:proliferating cell nuclear antigen